MGLLKDVPGKSIENEDQSHIPSIVACGSRASGIRKVVPSFE